MTIDRTAEGSSMKMTNPPDRDRLRKEKLGGTLQPLAAPANVVTLTANIPAELRARRQWVTWRSEPRPGGGKPTKIPYNTRSGRRASSTNPQSWSSLDHALAVVSRYDGVGYVFVADDAIVGIDLDGCRNPDTGALTLWAIEIIGATRSYTEISPSGRGLHVFVRGRLPTGRRK